MADQHQEPLERDPRDDVWATWPGSVLLDDEITYYCTEVTPKLIDPFCPDNLKPARYVLTLGSEARVGGRVIQISEQQPLIIPAHQVAIVRTYESLNIPRFLIGRWNLTVGMAYLGLLWVGALQVDPGWTGYLPCPFYNLSKEDVTIAYRARVFTIDFVRTTRFVVGKNLEYPEPPQRVFNPPLVHFDVFNLRSGPYEALQVIPTVTKSVEALEQKSKEDAEEQRQMRTWGMAAIGVLFAVVGAITAAVGVVAVRPVVTVGEEGRPLSAWPLTALAGAAAALILSVFAVYLCWQLRKTMSPGRQEQVHK